MESEKLFKEACQYIPGGVNSPVRAFRNVDMTPIFVERGKGCRVYDHDNNEYIDYIGSWGPLILGHASDILIEDIDKEIAMGTSFGLPTKKEIELAKIMVDAYPGMDMVRMVNSGTEATMSAIRVARGYTKRDKIIKFEGNYHGHSDCLLVQAGSGALTFQTPTSPGVPDDLIRNTLVCQYNDLESVKTMIQNNKDEIACIILEPVACNMGLVEATREFIQGLRDICNENQIVLIFDEVITGFRLSYQGAAGYYGVTPDLACFGKIIGGGLPVGAYGGKKELMSIVSPSGPVYQAGTLSGNPLAMTMGIRQLSYLRDHPEVYDHINNYALKLKQDIEKIIEENDYPCHVQCCGSLLTLFFKKEYISHYKDVQGCDLKAFTRYYQAMVKKGFIFAPSQFEGIFISYAHNENDLKSTLTAIKEALKECYEY